MILQIKAGKPENQMLLSNPFPLEVRLLYLGHWRCFLCGSNGWERGGLEIHHILGRISGSAFNSSCLCNYCHSHMGHSQEENRKIFLKTLEFLFNKEYIIKEEDIVFLRENEKELIGEEAKKWLKL